ncbi:hypothetical protein E3N88_22780 [Mikania micrantha]|uniref:Reverse transcriptase Ty1/copia-type domain-containing protein n=1 Tax=Mikania micrantha TaxID=192012 RepID=A0A5N6NCG8_9ASTR|nr:hypothetical protein E3N88_22780 [Mikania micrantha]
MLGPAALLFLAVIHGQRLLPPISPSNPFLPTRKPRLLIVHTTNLRRLFPEFLPLLAGIRVPPLPPGSTVTNKLLLFKVCLAKVCLADDQTLDIAGIGDVDLRNTWYCLALNDVKSNGSGSNGSESLQEEEDLTSPVQSSSIPGSSVPQSQTQQWWEIAMKDEMKSLEKNRIWVLTKLLSEKKTLQNKWPEGFRILGKENIVCKLNKSLYGLKQAPRQWYLKFDNFMGRNGFKRCEMDHCCYITKFSKSYSILLLYVDDMLIAEAEYMAAAEASKELIWLKSFLEKLEKKQLDSPLYFDNKSAIHLGKNPVFHGNMEHIQLRYHFIRG